MGEVKRYDAVHIRYEDRNIMYGEGCEVEIVAAQDYDAMRAEAYLHEVRLAYAYEALELLRAENAELAAALELYFRAGAGNSTDFKKQADARKKADAAKHRGE